MTGLDRLLTVEDLAEKLQVKPRTIYQWVHERYIPVVKLGSLVRFKPGTVIEWLEKREVPGRAVRQIRIELP